MSDHPGESTDISPKAPKKIDERVLKNQSPSTGQHVMLEVDGVLYEYFEPEQYDRAKRFANLLKTEIDWIEKYVPHPPTIGNHYEGVLRDLLADYLPSSLKVGTGFIYDSHRETASPQLDILVYMDTERSPMYRRGEFVIVDSKAAISVCEVKKNLTSRELISCINKTIGQNLGWCRSFPYGVQRMGIFSYKCRMKTENIVNIITKEITEYLGAFRISGEARQEGRCGIFQVALPSIYLLDRGEYVTTDLMRDAANARLARVRVCVNRTLGAHGVSPFLASMNPRTSQGLSGRDFVVSPLAEVVSDDQVEQPMLLLRRVGAAELVERFPDAERILRTPSPGGGRRYGVLISSYVDLDAKPTLASLIKEPGTAWMVWDGARETNGFSDK